MNVFHLKNIFVQQFRFCQLNIREFKKLQRLVQRKRYIKIELCVRLSILRFSSLLIMLYKIGELHFRLLGTNGFHVKAKSERFTAASSRCCQNLKYENFTPSFGRLHQKIAPKACRTCSTIISLHSTNQIFDLWRCR